LYQQRGGSLEESPLVSSDCQNPDKETLVAWITLQVDPDADVPTLFNCAALATSFRAVLHDASTSSGTFRRLTI
jgi:hypothetical protein